MFIELADSLRCVRPHADAWLVAAADKTEGRRVVSGTLGCHVCGARYRVEEGVAYLEGPAGPGPAPRDVPADPDEALRIAALLGLTDGGGLVVLHRERASAAEAVAALLSAAGVSAVVVALDPPPGVHDGDDLSVVRTSGVIPFAAGSLRALALGESDGPCALLQAAVRALATGARLVAPASCAVPPEVRELARDERVWVAERRAFSSAPVELRRAP